jgi:hypothetical protein
MADSRRLGCRDFGTVADGLLGPLFRQRASATTVQDSQVNTRQEEQKGFDR